MPLNNPHHRATATVPDPLTDSGLQRAIGTQIRLHMPDDYSVDVGLLDIANVSTWSDLAMLIGRRLPIEVGGPGRMMFAGGVVLWVEMLGVS
jgi:hypothetical protein